MNHYSLLTMACLCVLGLSSCGGSSEQPHYFEMEKLQENTSLVLWDPEVYDFEEGNKFCLERFAELEKAQMSLAGPGCTSWRNGNYHGRNLDWYQANYACLVVKMPKGGKVKHASVATVNSNVDVTHDFITGGVISDSLRKVLPAASTDGINDAGVAININIVPHQPGEEYVSMEGDLSCVSVVRYVLDNAGSVTEALDLLRARKVCQSLLNLAGDEAHYMISNADSTVVVEFPHGQMQVVCFEPNGEGWYSPQGNPAIMANFYDYVAELYPVDSDEFYDYHPTAMGVERWLTVREQYDRAATDVASNFAIAQSVWYYKNMMCDKTLWYTDNAVPGKAYGKAEQGWYYMDKGQRVAAASGKEAMQSYWNNYMEGYWQRYEQQYGSVGDPHLSGNTYWETSHSVVYDLAERKGYLWPFENYYSASGEPIVMELP